MKLSQIAHTLAHHPAPMDQPINIDHGQLQLTIMRKIDEQMAPHQGGQADARIMHLAQLTSQPHTDSIQLDLAGRLSQPVIQTNTPRSFGDEKTERLPQQVKLRSAGDTGAGWQTGGGKSLKRFSFHLG